MRARDFFALLAVVFLVGGCTFINKQSFEVEHSNSSSAQVIMNEIENYFMELGFNLKRKTHITYPKDERLVEFFLGQRSRPILYTSFDYAILRLENGTSLYLDWVRISDLKESPPPGYFDKLYKTVASRLKDKIGDEVSFKLVEQKDEH